MDTYQQIHDFTAAGAVRFAAFFAAHGATGFIKQDFLSMVCLGVLEDNLNGTGGPLTWELSGLESRDGQRHILTVELDDLIVEVVELDARYADIPDVYDFVPDDDVGHPCNT